jgi:transposase
VARESKTESTAEAIAGELAKAPTCRRIVFETGADPVSRVEPTWSAGGLCREPAGLPGAQVTSHITHTTDRNDARGPAHLARTGFFKPVHVKSLQAHALRSLIIARKKLVGQRVTLENQIRGLGVVFGVDCPARSRMPSSITPLKQARGSLVSPSPCGD